MDYKKSLKRAGMISLAITSPTVYAVQHEIRKGKYETRWGRAVGTTVAGGLTALVCLIVPSVWSNGLIRSYSAREGVISERIIQEEDQNLQIKQREYFSANEEMILRGAIFPGEGLVRRFLIGNYPKTKDTAFSGTIKKEGLEIAIEGEIPGWIDSSKLTPELLARGTKEAKVLPESYESLYKAN